MRKQPITFQELILALDRFWADQGCTLMQPYDMEVGAGTFHPATFFGSLGPHPANVAYAQPTRRPTDGRFGDNPLRTQHYYQYQVILKPSPDEVQALYLKSLKVAGINFKEHDLRFVQVDWESPTLGASGLGWEVWLDSLEVTQFTYFQQMGGYPLDPISCEITYGLERICRAFDSSRTDQPAVTGKRSFWGVSKKTTRLTKKGIVLLKGATRSVSCPFCFVFVF